RSLPRSRAAVRYLWGIYTKPTPDAAREVLALMLLCFIISLVSSGFLYNWMADTLSYGQATSAAVAGFCGPIVFLLLLLVHPARCLFTLALPTLGTKQGRKLVLSSAMMLLLLNVVPNITANVGVLSHMLKCTSESLVQGLIDFSDVMNRAKADVIGEAIKVQKAEPQFVRSLTEFHHFTHINVTEIKDRVSSVSKNIERDFSNTSRILRHIQSVANRLLAAFFVICLLFESARYLKSYLTNVKFDNTCISGTLLSMACDKGLEISPGNMRNLNRSTSCGISRQEFLRCMPRIVAVTLYLVVTVLFIVLDYMVYHLISASKPWVLDIPPANISISVEYKVKDKWLFHSVVDFRRTYHGSLSARPERCAADLYEPHQRVVFLLGFLYLVAYSMVFLEVYAMRSRRAVASSFFKWQEEKRVAFLCQKVLAKEEKKSGIFFIKATHGVNKLE
uniref:Osteoclast stimulatory transmembrane protein n=1 Tax=Scleropages formosus TaxID=113540 RepID=A0A8C9V8V3_SCLFO